MSAYPYCKCRANHFLQICCEKSQLYYFISHLSFNFSKTLLSNFIIRPSLLSICVYIYYIGNHPAHRIASIRRRRNISSRPSPPDRSIPLSPAAWGALHEERLWPYADRIDAAAAKGDSRSISVFIPIPDKVLPDIRIPEAGSPYERLGKPISHFQQAPLPSDGASQGSPPPRS